MFCPCRLKVVKSHENYSLIYLFPESLLHQNKWHINVDPGPEQKNGFFWDKGSCGKSPVYFVIGAGSLEAGVFVVEIDHSLKAFGKKEKEKNVCCFDSR